MDATILAREGGDEKRLQEHEATSRTTDCPGSSPRNAECAVGTGLLLLLAVELVMLLLKLFLQRTMSRVAVAMILTSKDVHTSSAFLAAICNVRR